MTLTFNITDYVSNNRLLNEYRNIKKRQARVTAIRWLIKAQAKTVFTGQVAIHIIRYGCQLMDWDNFYGGAKPFLDALRKNGVIQDDNPTIVVRLTGEQFKVKKHKDETVIIQITEP